MAKDDINKLSPLLSWDVSSMRRHELSQESDVKNEAREIQNISDKNEWKLQMDYESILREELVMVVTNSNRNIEWVSTGFEEMTGYVPDEVVGKKPSILQGKETNEDEILRIRQFLDNGQRVSSKLVNYRKNGDRYICAVDILPIFNKDDELVHFLGIEYEELEE